MRTAVLTLVALALVGLAIIAAPSAVLEAAPPDPTSPKTGGCKAPPAPTITTASSPATATVTITGTNLTSAVTVILADPSHTMYYYYTGTSSSTGSFPRSPQMTGLSDTQITIVDPARSGFLVSAIWMDYKTCTKAASGNRYTLTDKTVGFDVPDFTIQ